tara:strand:- start:5613 stop:5969 length:357 start_codon:yes stop_codon:yes gene_type:complete
MSPLDAAWTILKSRPVSSSGKQYSPQELQQLRAFVNANIESPDPNLQAQAQQILEELTTAMSFAGGRTSFNTPSEPIVPGAGPVVRGAGGPAASVGVRPPLPPEPSEEDEDDDKALPS